MPFSEKDKCLILYGAILATSINLKTEGMFQDLTAHELSLLLLDSYLDKED